MTAVARRGLRTSGLIGLLAVSTGSVFATPAISITAPASGSTIALVSSPAGATITATATPTAGSSIVSVQFFDNGTSIGTVGGTSPFSINWVPTTAGSHTLTATVTDNSVPTTGTTPSVNTATATSIVTVTTARTSTVLAPKDVTIAQGSEIFLRAAATISDAIIGKVEFILDGGGTPVATKTTAPFNVPVILSAANGFTVGSHTLVARATSTDDAIVINSAPVSFNVAAPVVGNQPPVVALTAPTAGATVSVNGNVLVTATASDPDGFIPNTPGAGVTFFVDGDPITQGASESNPDLIPPYSVTWRPTVAKTYSLRAQTIDNTNNVVLSPAISVTATTVAPAISLTAPTTAVLGANVTFTATATSGSGGNVTQVEFLVDGAVISTDTTSPYAATWPATPLGAHTITARLTDSNGATATSTPQTLTVVNVSGPTVTLTAPATGTVGTVTTINATTTVGGTNTISSVQFFANGTSIGTDTTSPFSLAWTPNAAGTFSITATVTDSTGATANSSPITMTITPTGTSANLTLALTPANSSMPPGTSRLVTVTVPAGVGADRVELYFDGQIVGTDTLAPFSFVFTAPEAFGPHFLSATAFSATGTQTSSNAFPISISGALGSAPLVAILSPNNGAFIGLASGTPPTPATPITGTVSDLDGSITSVQVIVNGASIGNATVSGSTWTINWTPTVSGTASITAIATDNNGNAVAAPAVGVTVTDASSPAIALTISPRTSATLPASTTLPSGAVKSFLAEVVPAPGRAVVRVEFFVDGTKVGEDTTAPYTYRYVAPELAPDEQSHLYVLSARATDNAGSARDSLVPLLVVSPIGQPPTVSLLTPANGAAVAPNAPVSLAATAVGNGGSIAFVQFYVNGSPAGINNGLAVTAAPYTATFTPTTPGSYVIDAIATDDRGNTSVSNAATITASFATPTIAFTSPNPNAVARATPNVPLTLSATATVQGGAGAAVLLVEFLLDGVQIGARTVPNTPNGNLYSFSWLPTAANLGQHVLTARVTDTNSQVSTSAPVTVNVANVVGSPPTVSVVASPIPALFGLQTASTVNFLATAVATGTGSALSNVEIFLNDLSIGLAAREQNTNFYRLAYDLNRFDFTALTPTINDVTGAVTYPVRLYAIARDSNNNQTVSATTNLVINPATSTPPSVQLQALTPTTITAGTQVFFAPNINDLDGAVTTLQLFANGTAVGTFANPQQGQPIFYTPNQAGRFNVYAVATDDTGNTAVSTPAILITVTAVSAPVTTITRPTANTTTATVASPVFLEGTAVNSATTQVPVLQFIATAAGGARQVINGTRVGTTTTYRAIWTPTNPDTYTVTTQASVGNVQGTSTASRRVVVSDIVGLAPSITLTRAAGVSGVPGTATTASTADFAATALDPDGAVVEVEFFLNRNSIGLARRDPIGNTWRINAAFAGLQPGATEIVALARDSSGNIVASPTSNVTVNAATSIAPSITITPSTTNPAFNRQVQLRANARDTDGTVNAVQYFANATAIATSNNAGSLFLSNWTPTASGTYYLWAVATDNSGITTVSPTVEVIVRRNNPVLENAAFILQTYQDIANTTNINPIVFDETDEALGAGRLSRSDLVVTLMQQPGFDAPVNLLAAYYVLMGQWPTPQNYTTLLATARNNFANAVGGILTSNEYFAKYGATPTAGLLNNPASDIPADTFIPRLWQGAGLPPPSALSNLQFRSNNTLTATLGRGYNPIGLNGAVAEFITNTNSGNTALFAKARAAALFYQLTRPPVTVTVDEITARVNALLPLTDSKAIADMVLKDILYGYRYVTITKHPQSLTVAPRSGVIFSVEAQGAPPLVYQWLLNGAPIPGASNALLSLTNVDTTRVGSYSAVITSSAGVATSDAAVLTLSNTPTRLANISTRGVTNAGANVLIGGFVVTGANAQQTRQMLIRVVGPTLGAAPFNVAGVLANPRLEVYSGNNPNPVLTNDDWNTQAGGAAQVTAIQQATTRAAAFTLPNNSLDAVVLATLQPGSYTVQAKGPANNPAATGVVLIEVYDVTQGNAAGPKAANVSTRGNVGTGTNILIAGFVVNGGVTRRMLIRGAGPTLANLGVPGVLADPQLTLIDQSTGRTIATNDNWASGDDAAIIAAASVSAGAFPLANGSRDAAMIIMLPPGAYTAQLSGVNNGTGVGIVEVYDVDP